GTFYLHYPDTTALMRSVESDLLGEIQALVDAHMGETVEGRSLRPVFEPVLDYVVAHRETCAALFNSDSASGFLEQLQKLVYRNGKALLWAAVPDRAGDAGSAGNAGCMEDADGVQAGNSAQAGNSRQAGNGRQTEDDAQAANLLSFVTFGLVGLVKNWFDGNMALPREELLRTADALASGAAAGFRDGLTGGAVSRPPGKRTGEIPGQSGTGDRDEKGGSTVDSAV
ncbi:MAG: TetR family transcriptional regulator C-terminal domain-containing protein, partial [Oscillibacter sp.]|nr:TetR family transcriptional regulator C-terminal domain-containing protein [Oscillibacter sp.]